MPFPLPPLAEQRRIAFEARRRLEDSRVQAEAVQVSLARLPALEAEILATAIGGVLVPQSDLDEPAAALLERLGPPPLEEATLQKTQERDEVKTTRRENGEDRGSGADLATILREAGRPLRLPDLFLMAGYNRDLTEHVEEFYLALRAELGISLRQTGTDGENAIVELVTDAP
jgi:type I restriction enzyme, S subunit